MNLNHHLIRDHQESENPFMEQHDPLFYGMLNVFAAQVDDLEGLRIASNHRYRLLATSAVDKDDVVRGLNLGVDHPEAKRLRDVIAEMESTERAAIRNLERLMKNSAWWPWLSRAKGVGAKQLARLLATIGDPYWHAVEERPRRVGELWAYAGMHAVPVNAEGKPIAEGEEPAYFTAPRRQRGVQGNWSEEARKRVWLVATSCMKTSGGKYREKYDATRAKYEEAVHEVPCVRCGPSGKPAPVGSELSKGHKHGRALRAVSKEVLLDLWIEARRLHGIEPETEQERQARMDGYARQRAAAAEQELVSA
jgi:hypothetical protein